MVREAANCLAEFTTSYDRLQLWLKFESGCTALDSSNMRVPRLYGSPLKLPAEKGMHSNWGAFFSFGDLLVLDDPVRFERKEWSISFWMTTPVVDTGKQHTLVQSVKGIRYVVIDPTGLRLGIYDRAMRKYRNALKMDKLGTYMWHNVIITYSEGKVKYYIDLAFKKKMTVKCNDPIKFIGNSADGMEPFGTFCDLRIADHVLTSAQMKLYSSYAPNFVDVLPDCLAANICGAVPFLAKTLHLNIAPTTAAVLRFFANLASNGM